MMEPTTYERALALHPWAARIQFLQECDDLRAEVKRLTLHAHDCAELDRANEDLGRALTEARAELKKAHITVAELLDDQAALQRENAHFASRAQSAEEQLAAHELETSS